MSTIDILTDVMTDADCFHRVMNAAVRLEMSTNAENELNESEVLDAILQAWLLVIDCQGVA